MDKETRIEIDNLRKELNDLKVSLTILKNFVDELEQASDKRLTDLENKGIDLSQIRVDY